MTVVLKQEKKAVRLYFQLYQLAADLDFNMDDLQNYKLQLQQVRLLFIV